MKNKTILILVFSLCSLYIFGQTTVISDDYLIKKIRVLFLIMIICFPNVAFAHNLGEAIIFCGLIFILSLIITIILLKQFNKMIFINNKFTRFFSFVSIRN